ncbi:sigma-70 family RNA polymerase sigma factor [Lapidilactobacillus wuchangensis]|uniref:sigma-70 family RNA polymerase sigma factor n=1 Tax=Lapidilactobacillus wuchangensis TaxID=2486001 RepID=UPI000F79FC4D|nr:sigma-70 family RNA polymerase sigma factor [Lapidilactobacillus wuchangensis]
MKIEQIAATTANKRTITAGLTAALDQQGLIHGAIKRAGVWRHHQDYDDFLQEAYLVYAQAYQQYPGDPAQEAQFLPYVFQQICWRMTDLLRYQQRRQMADLPTKLPGKLPDFSEHSVVLMLLQQMTQQSSAVDQLIIREHFILGRPLSALATKYQLSPRTLRARRYYLRQRLAKQLATRQ